ncbi:MAG TPA: hypothetical protein VGQ26_06310 [Streptosporangiaceae bacterium]|jgi:hypothetical protein|nr:hypothetical protein [Streptosporangiaceae bacterium]
MANHPTARRWRLPVVLVLVVAAAGALLLGPRMPGLLGCSTTGTRQCPATSTTAKAAHSPTTTTRPGLPAAGADAGAWLGERARRLWDAVTNSADSPTPPTTTTGR